MSIEQVLAGLEDQIGAETHVSDWLAITQERVNQFAEATLDRQWIHVDPGRAQAESPFGGAIAHGFFTLALIPYLTGGVNPEKPPLPGVTMTINYGVNKVRFPHPVRVGARVRARSRLLSATAVKGGLQLVHQVTIEIDGEPKPGCVAETVSLHYF